MNWIAALGVYSAVSIAIGGRAGAMVGLLIGILFYVAGSIARRPREVRRTGSTFQLTGGLLTKRVLASAPVDDVVMAGSRNCWIDVNRTRVFVRRRDWNSLASSDGQP